MDGIDSGAGVFDDVDLAYWAVGWIDQKHIEEMEREARKHREEIPSQR